MPAEPPHAIVRRKRRTNDCLHPSFLPHSEFRTIRNKAMATNSGIIIDQTGPIGTGTVFISTLPSLFGVLSSVKIQSFENSSIELTIKHQYKAKIGDFLKISSKKLTNLGWELD